MQEETDGTTRSGPTPATPEAAPQAAGTAPPSPLIRRLFGISFWGALKLLGMCILTGFFVLAANFDPRSPSFDAAAALSAIFRQSLAALGWALSNFWQPALAGALLVLPVWVLWRLVSFPFRK
jgi:hypothetical protein